MPKHIKQTDKDILKDGLEDFGKSRAVYIGRQVAENINMGTHINLNQSMETGQDHDPTSSTSATNTESHDPTSPTSATHTESYNSTPSASATNAESQNQTPSSSTTNTDKKRKHLAALDQMESAAPKSLHT